MRVATRNGIDGIAITSSASTSSEIRIAPSWAVNPQPTVAARAIAGHQRRDLAGVEVGGDEAGEGGGAELVEGGVAGEAHLGAGEEASCRVMTPTVPPMTASAPRAEGDLGEDPEDLLAVAADRARRPRDDADVERELLAEVVEGPQRLW